MRYQYPDFALPVYSYIIVSVSDGEPDEMTSWIMKEDRSGFDKQRIAVSE